MGGRPLTPASTETTGSFATALAHTPSGMGGPEQRIAEIDISRQGGARIPSCVPQLTEEEARQAATFASADGSAYVCWLCRTHGHAMYACPFLAPEQWMFTAYRNYRYQLQTRPGMRNLLQQSVAGDRGPCSSHANRPGEASVSPLEEEGIAANNATSDKPTRDTRAKMEEENAAGPDCRRGYRTR